MNDQVNYSKIQRIQDDLDALVIGQFGTGFVTDAMLYESGIKSTVASHTSQLAENVTQNFRKKNVTTNNSRTSKITFIDDDAMHSVIDRWKPICDLNNIKIDMSVITGIVGTSLNMGGYIALTLSQIKSLYEEGYNVVSHTNYHYNPDTHTTDEVESDYKLSKEWLLENGFVRGANTLVYPATCPLASNLTIKNIARKYYDYAITCNNANNGVILDNYAIERVMIDTKTLEQLKVYVDSAYSNNTWLVFLTHSWDTNTWDGAKIQGLIDYIKGKGIEIVTSDAALETMGNIVYSGEITDADSGALIISKDGTNTVPIAYDSTQTILLDKPVTDYPKKITVCPIFASRDTYLGIGGELITFNTSENGFKFQMFKPYNTNQLHMRSWNYGSSVWNSFEKIAGKSTHYVVTSATLDKPISEYTVDSETVVRISISNDTTFNQGGIMRVYRSATGGFTHAEYTTRNNNIYSRWDDGTNTSWGSWVHVAQPIA